MNRMLGLLLLVLVSTATPPLAGGQSSPAVIAQLKNRAAGGDATAQTNLGLMYAIGGVLPKDCAEAMKWYRLAAAQGNASALTLAMTRIRPQTD